MIRPDYRSSHLQKGDVYDNALASDPFDRFMAVRETAVLGDILSRLFPNGVRRHLDFACGTGRILSIVRGIAAESYGVDISESMLRKARQTCPKAALICADLTRETRDIGQFGLVTAFRFFGNAEDTLRRAALSAIHGLLEPGGYLVLNNHRNPRSLRNLLHPGSDENCDLHHGKLRMLLNQSGFDVVRRHGIGWWVVLDRQSRAAVLESAWGLSIDRALFCGRVFAPLSPDCIVVARRLSR